ncbi:DUF2207 domain-containing protein [Kribbella sp. CA-247076]|uniref:DUF2207 domain-containing protein n=1 Tax=Kribbella sp. CA-247076 TaxID=3239941 RepID=UPI003D8A2F4E
MRSIQENVARTAEHHPWGREEPDYQQVRPATKPATRLNPRVGDTPGMVDGRVMRIVALTFLVLCVAWTGLVVRATWQGYEPERFVVAPATVQYDVQPDGVLDVTETIHWGDVDGPGDRVVQVRRPEDARLDTSVENRGKDRVWKVTDISVTDTAGKSVDFSTDELDPLLPPLFRATSVDGFDTRLSDLRIQISPEGTALHGATYILKYSVHGALDRTEDGYELHWPDPRRLNDEWSDDISRHLRATGTEIRVSTPTDPTGVACHAHRRDAAPVPCSTVTATGRTAAFAHEGGGALIITVRMPADSITKGGPRYDASPRPHWMRIAAYATGTVLLLTLVGLVTHRVLRRRASGGTGLP